MSENPILDQNTEALQVFRNATSFDTAQRMATALSKSTIVPKEYQNNISNCLIALEMASRLQMPPMMVMQNLYIVNGKPGWGSSIIIGLINNSRRYKCPLQFELKGKGDAMTCICWAIDQLDNRIEGPLVSMEMAKKEGWLGKSGSKWATMPEVMIRYRAASFFGRLYCPDILFGFYTAEEVEEMEPSKEEAVSAEIKEKANKEPVDVNYTVAEEDPVPPTEIEKTEDAAPTPNNEEQPPQRKRKF